MRSIWFYIINKININRYNVSCKYNKIKINGIVNFSGNNNISIGENVKINSGKRYNVIGGDTRTIIHACKNANIVIKNNVGISNSTIISHNSVIIEDDVKIGGGTKIYDTDFHSIDFNERMQIHDIGVKSGPIIIGKGAFIGAHSIILKNVKIGKNSVIGAGSVVTKSVPDKEIWAGNPAVFIRKI